MARFALTLVALTAAQVTTAAEPTPNARQVAEAYLAAARAGKAEVAAKLGLPGKSPSRPKAAEEVKAMTPADKLPVETVLASAEKNYALAVTQPFRGPKPDAAGRDLGCIVLTLNKTADGWRVRDIDFRSPEEVMKRLKEAKERFKDATEIPAARP